MTNYKEILRLGSLGINNSQIAAVLGCSRTTVITVQKRAGEADLTHVKAMKMSNREVSKALFPDNESGKPVFKMPDYE
jgi:transcriptional regulator